MYTTLTFQGKSCGHKHKTLAAADSCRNRHQRRTGKPIRAVARLDGKPLNEAEWAIMNTIYLSRAPQAADVILGAMGG